MKKTIFYLLIILFSFNYLSFAGISTSIDGVTTIGGVPFTSTDFTINYTFSGSESGTWVRYFGPGGTYLWSASDSGSFGVSGLNDGDYNFVIERYSGEVTIGIAGGEVILPDHDHTVVVNPDTVSVTIEPYTFPNAITVDGATATIREGTYLLEGTSVRVVVDKTPPVISNTNFFSIPEHTNSSSHTLTGHYLDNFLGGRVGVVIEGGGITYTSEVTISSKASDFSVPFLLQEGENKVKIFAVDNAPGHNTYSTQTRTIVYDSSIPVVSAGTDITFPSGDIRGNNIGSKEYKIQVKFTDDVNMDTTEVVNASLRCITNNVIQISPDGTETGWSSQDTWTGKFFIPKNQGSVYDGAVNLTISGAKDISGNVMTTYTENNIFVIDTTAPATNTSKPPIPNYVELINPVNGILSENDIISFRFSDIIWAQGAGIDSSELSIWIDANGDGLETPKELITFNDTAEAAIDGTTIINAATTIVTIDPSKFDPANKFTSFTGTNVKMEIRNIKDAVSADFGGPNVGSNVTYTFNVDLQTRPVGEFVVWAGDSAEITATPPLDSSLSIPIPFDPEKLAHTPYADQQIKFNIIPAGDVTENPNYVIDTSSIILMVNGYPYNIMGTGQPYESPAMTITSNAEGTVEVTWNPALDPAVGIGEGFVKVKIAQAKDKNGTSIIPVDTAFIVDTQKPQIVMNYPLDGYSCFNYKQDIVFDAIDNLPGLTGTIEVKVVNTTGTESRVIENSLRAGEDSSIGEILILKDPESSKVTVKLDTDVEYKEGKVDVTIKVYDRAGNTVTENVVFWVLRNLQLGSAIGSNVFETQTITVNAFISNIPEGIDQDTRSVSLTSKVTNANNISFEKDVYFNETTESAGARILPLSFENVTLNEGENAIMVTVLDSMGSKINYSPGGGNGISDLTINVVYDNKGPIGAYNLYLKNNDGNKASIEWNDFTDMYSNPVKYKVQIAVESTFNTIFKEIITVNSDLTMVLDDITYNNFYVRVIAVDSLDNEADPSDHIIVKSDSQRPAVESVIVQDNTPDSNYSESYPNNPELVKDLSVLITFDEAMNQEILLSQEKRLRIKFDDNTYYNLDSGEWISSKVWKADFNKDVFPSRFSGKYKFYVKEAKDAQNNMMYDYVSSEFVLDQVPEIETPKIFPNPLDEREIIVLVRSLETLKENPRVEIDDETVDFNYLNYMWYGASYRMRASQSGIRSLSVTVTDKNGNIGHWPEDYSDQSGVDFNIFKTAILEKDNDTYLRSASDKAELFVKKESVNNDEEIYSMIYNEDVSKIKNAPSLVSSLSSDEDELIRKSENIVYAPYLKLDKKADITFFEKDVSDKTVIMRKTPAGWKYVETVLDKDKVIGKTDILGTFALFVDNEQPEAIFDIKDNEKIFDINRNMNVQIIENGSGIKNVSLYIDNTEINSKLDDSNRLNFSPSQFNEEGEHEIKVVAEDNAGNKTVKKVIFRAPGALNISTLSAYPNPAQDFINIKYSINSVASRLEFKVYDVKGKLVYKDRVLNPALNGILNWDLMDRRGKTVANGVYLYTVEVIGSNEIKKNGKIVVLR